MKIQLVILMIAITLVSCGGDAAKQPANADGFAKMDEIVTGQT